MTINGKEVAVLQPKGDGYELNENALERILLNDEVKDRYVVVVSVAGDYRKGKSFLLDYFLRYLNYTYASTNRKEEDSNNAWMGGDDDPLEGFSWRYGSKRQTKGIWMWSRAFLTTSQKNEQIAILLLDTQGSFDTESTMNQAATVFALSTMVSSSQCYNISKNIQENDINNLQFFTEYGRIALEYNDLYKPFQKLIFLVRDWEYPGEAGYGEAGGRIILDERLKFNPELPPEKKLVRKHIRTCFSDVRCFLMPHPGPAITDPRFNGRLNDLSFDFKIQLGTLVPWILAPENLIIKRISGKKIKAKELKNFFKTYAKVFSGRDLPEPKTLYMATADGNNLVAVAESKELYNKMMVQTMGNQRKYVQPLVLRSEHEKSKKIALQYFEATVKIGGDDYSKQFKEQLDEDLENMFKQFYRDNYSRKYWYWKKPVLLVGAAITFVALSQVIQRMGVTKLLLFSNVVWKVALFCVVSWFYSRHRNFSGRTRSS